MKLVEKDWMYDVKIIEIILATFLAGIVLVLLLLLSPKYPLTYETLKVVCEKVYTITILLLTLYPMFAFKAVCPQIGSDKLYISTANLPFSRKQVFFKGIKSGLIIFPIYILVGAAVVTVLSEQTEALWILYLFALIKPLVIMVFMVVFQLQVIAAVIFSLTKRIKWYKIVSSVLIANISLGLLCTLVILLLDIDIAQNFYWGFGVILAYILTSFGAFLIAWKDVEKVYQ